jgi:uncharacterized membrane protein
VENQGLAKPERSSKDRSRMWLLTGLAALSGLVSGIPLLNAIFFLIGLVSLIILNVRYGYLPAVMGAVLVIVASLFLYGPFQAIGCLLIGY